MSAIELHSAFAGRILKLGSLVLAGVALLSGCDRNPLSPTPQRAPPMANGADPSHHLELGAAVLAAVENARNAIALRDPIAATNDIRQALSYAKMLPDRPSRLILATSGDIDQASARQGSLTRQSPRCLTDFQALVKLGAARSLLQRGDQRQADVELLAIQTGIPHRPVPIDLPLMQARESLEMAQSAAFTGRVSELRTQLLGAELALNTYAGPRHATEAKKLAFTIGQHLSEFSLLSDKTTNLLPLWSAKVNTWD